MAFGRTHRFTVLMKKLLASVKCYRFSWKATEILWTGQIFEYLWHLFLEVPRRQRDSHFFVLVCDKVYESCILRNIPFVMIWSLVRVQFQPKIVAITPSLPHQKCESIQSRKCAPFSAGCLLVNFLTMQHLSLSVRRNGLISVYNFFLKEIKIRHCKSPFVKNANQQ